MSFGSKLVGADWGCESRGVTRVDMCEAMVPISMHTRVVFEGGCSKRPYAPWNEDLEEVDGSLFMGVRSSDRGFAGLLGLNLVARSPWEGICFLEYLIKLRNKMVLLKLAEVLKKQDPDGDDVGQESPLKNRRTFVDSVPRVLTISIDATGDYEAWEMKVLSSTNAGDILFFEATSENINFLAKAVHFHTTSKSRKSRLVYDESFPAVKKRRMGDKIILYINYTDGSGKHRSKNKTLTTSFESELMHAHEKSVAAELQEQYEELNATVEVDAPSASASDPV
jgi:hypothetical protein